MANQTHLTLEQRQTIRILLEKGFNCSQIARKLQKDPSTIRKELRKHRKIQAKRISPKTHTPIILDCVHMQECGYTAHSCLKQCDKYQMISCKQRDRSPGVCNGCESYKKCRFTKFLYFPEKAQEEYIYTLSDSRSGINLTSSQALKLGEIIAPLIKKKQSLYVIAENHPELNVCSKTLYNYINQGLFSQNGVIDLDLRYKTKRKPPKQQITFKPRENRAYLKDRTHNDFLLFLETHPNASIVEMDTVYNDVSNGPFIQTFQFVDYSIMIGLLHKEKTSFAMTKGVNTLKEMLGDDFPKLVSVLLTDRGTEFTDAAGIEALGCKVFYCDPMASCQKPHVENNHIILRWILPKQANLTELGLRSQDDLNLVFSHINSYKRESLKNKSAFDILSFYQSSDIISKLHLKVIPNDEICLKPSLLKKVLINE